MTCNSRWAEAWEYQAFWCKSSLLMGAHDGANNAGSLHDTIGQFITSGVRAMYGMVLYNLTDGSSGPVTAADEESLTANLTGGTDNDWDTGDEYRIVPISAREIAQINHALNTVAPDVTLIVSSRGQCDCLTASALELLKKFNIIEAASFHNCSCSGPSSTPEERQQWRDWMTAQLGMIARGEIDLCGGTGSLAPAFGVIQQAPNDFAAANIIYNRRRRNLP